MKKVEIIERITDANGSISENILTSWEHKNQFILEIIRFGELKIYLQELIIKKNDSDVHLSKYEYDILLLLAKSPGRIFGKKWFMIWYGMNLIPVIIMWLCDISAISEKK